MIKSCLAAVGSLRPSPIAIAVLATVWFCSEATKIEGEAGHAPSSLQQELISRHKGKSCRAVWSGATE